MSVKWRFIYLSQSLFGGLAVSEVLGLILNSFGILLGNLFFSTPDLAREQGTV